MIKILLAVGFRQLEDYLTKQLQSEFLFVGETIYKEGIVRAIGQTDPDIVIIRETLSGNENIMNIIYEIRSKFPKVRIVFIAGKRDAGDELLATLVNYGVYDILQGDKVQANQIIALVRKPNEYKDVKHYQPTPLKMDKDTKTFDVHLSRKDEGNQETNRPAEDAPPQVKEEKPEKKGFFAKLPIDINMKPQTDEAKVRTEKPSKDRLSKEKLMPITKNIQGSNQNILTFIGGRSGVGTTSIAVNVALTLALNQKKVLFVEMNDSMPAVPYWFEIGHITKGIDTCLKAMNTGDFDEIEKAIVKITDLASKEGDLQKSYKKFPKTLDFLTFSKSYLAGDKNGVDYEKIKELYLYLMFQLEYDFVILDVPADIKSEFSTNALMYSNKVFTIVTQDVSSLGYHLFNLNELERKGIQIKKKNHYILNRFEPADISLQEIIDWVESKNVITMPFKGKEFINANFVGLPVCLYSKNADIKDSLLKIVLL